LPIQIRNLLTGRHTVPCHSPLYTSPNDPENNRVGLTELKKNMNSYFFEEEDQRTLLPTVSGKVV